MPGAAKAIALTFDGGASNQGTSRILQTLADTGTEATFFLTGDFAQRYPEASASIARRHPVGNHSQTHPDLTTLPDVGVRKQIADAEAAIKAVTGVDPRPYFRFPFGARDARTIGLANDACYVPFRWTVDTLGWKGTSDGMSVEKVTQRVLDGASPGGIILMHLGAHPSDGSTLDADALPGIIAGLKAKGYALVTLEVVI